MIISSYKSSVTGVANKAKLIKITNIQIDGDVVYSVENTNDNTTKTKENASNVKATSSANEESTKTKKLPTMVKLSKDDPKFVERKARLKELGYRWSSELTAWLLPTDETKATA